MTFLLTIALVFSLKGIPVHKTMAQQISDCGIRPARRQPRQFNEHFFYKERMSKIIAGSSTKDGQFPWQASLELLHPSMGFLGHWCGGVLIHKNWVLSAAHCVHNDLFNLPLPPLWTIVLGEHDRMVESGYEQRIPVEKIILHQSYHNFVHDLVLMKLSMPADISISSNIRKICLPFTFDDHSQSSLLVNNQNDLDYYEPFEKEDNFLRQFRNRNRNSTLISMKELMEQKIRERIRKASKRRGRLLVRHRYNDKLMNGFGQSLLEQMSEGKQKLSLEYSDLPYIDCIATGWGKANTSGDITNILLKTSVPLHSSSKCRDAYGSFVKIHKGHLCAGKLNGKGGTCVGDSGGPLQCRLTKNGPWILAGVTSFGSGCAVEGYPDVYTRTSFYMRWIRDTISSDNYGDKG